MIKVDNEVLKVNLRKAKLYVNSVSGFLKVVAGRSPVDGEIHSAAVEFDEKFFEKTKSGFRAITKKAGKVCNSRWFSI